MAKKIKAKDYKYQIFVDYHSFDPPGMFFFMKTEHRINWSGGEVILKFSNLRHAKRFMAFAKLFDCTYE